MRVRETLACVGLIVVLAGAAEEASAQQELLKLTASDGAQLDFFGGAVAISGDRAIVGAPRQGTLGLQAGAAYLFDASTGQELFKLTASNGGQYHEFGISVAIDGNRAIVGAFQNPWRGGAAYVFDVQTGQELFLLTASDGVVLDEFGISVAIRGDRAIVGSRSDDDLGSASGSAYVFDVTTGQELFKLNASDGAAGDVFGQSVAIDGTHGIVGASNANGYGGTAYIFDLATGQQVYKLGPSNPGGGSFFGVSVAIDGYRAIVGADGNNAAGLGAGSAYLFDPISGQELFRLNATDAATADHFGRSVAISGDLAIVGACRTNDFGEDSGSAYVFDVRTGQQLFELHASDAAENDTFGLSVAIDHDRAIVGSPADDDLGNMSGSAYIYALRLDCNQNGIRDDRDIAMGTSRDLDGDGIPDECGAGTLYCFGDGSATACPCGNSAAAGEGCANSFGHGAFLLPTGTGSVVLDDLGMMAGHLVPAAPALLFAGGQPVAGGNGLVFGDGLRCAGGGVTRIGLQVPDGSGYASWGPGLVSNGGWFAGSSRYLQVWYRDPAGSPCTAGFNLTGAVELIVSP